MSAVDQLFCPNIALLGKSWQKLINQDSLNSNGLILGKDMIKKSKSKMHKESFEPAISK